MTNGCRFNLYVRVYYAEQLVRHEWRQIPKKQKKPPVFPCFSDLLSEIPTELGSDVTPVL